MEHSKTFGISGAGRWVYCSGHVKLMQDEPEQEPTQESMEGDATHFVGECMLRAYKATGYTTAVECGEAMVGITHANGVIITEEMFDVALCYLDKIYAVVGDDPKRRAMLIVEQRVEARSIDPECWGTPDAFFYEVDTNTLYVWDLKNGHGRVDVFENYQLLGYSQAICETFSYTRLNPRLNLNIVQPRCYDGRGSIENWTVAFDHIRGYVNKMKSAVGEHRMAMSKLRTGKWCKHCKTSHKCPAIRQAGGNAIDVSMDTISREMTPDSMSYEKGLVEHALLILKERQSALDSMIEKNIRDGKFIPGYRMQDTVSSKKWKNNDPKTMEMMGQLLGVETMNEPKPLTPTQVLTKLKKNKIDESVIMPYYHTTKTGVKVVPDDGSRAKQIFSQEKI